MMRESWWGRQLQREDLITTLEQGRRVEIELFQEKHRGLRTMGELLKARIFGATEWAISLRKRMTNYLDRAGEGRGSSVTAADEHPSSEMGGRGIETHSRPDPAAGPHSWPCDDPFCQPCEDGVKRLLRDVGIIPRKGRAKR
jgi:hypothetical protein